MRHFNCVYFPVTTLRFTHAEETHAHMPEVCDEEEEDFWLQ